MKIGVFMMRRIASWARVLIETICSHQVTLNCGEMPECKKQK